MVGSDGRYLDLAGAQGKAGWWCRVKVANGHAWHQALPALPAWLAKESVAAPPAQLHGAVPWWRRQAPGWQCTVTVDEQLPAP